MIRKILGLIVLIAGIILVISAVQQLREPIPELSGFTREVWNPIMKFFGGTPKLIPSKHSAESIIQLIGGIIVSLIGVRVLFKSNKT